MQEATLACFIESAEEKLGENQLKRDGFGEMFLVRGILSIKACLVSLPIISNDIILANGHFYQKPLPQIRQGRSPHSEELTV